MEGLTTRRPPEEVARLTAAIEALRQEGTVVEVACAKVGVPVSTYKGWVIKASRAAKANGETPPNLATNNTGKYSRLEKLKIVKRFKNGERAVTLAKEFGVHEASIRGWAQGKWLGDSGVTSAKHPLDVRAEALKRLAQGETPTQVALALKIKRSSIYNWKLTREKKLIKAMEDNAMVPVPTHVEAAPDQSEGRGGRIKQAAAILQMGIESSEKRIKSGRLSLKDSATAYLVLALNTLLGE